MLAFLSFTAFGSAVDGATASEAARPRTVAGLLAFEDDLFAADATGDVGVVERGFDADAVFVHAGGAIESRDQYVAAMRRKESPTSVRGLDRDARVVGHVGLVRGMKEVSFGARRLSGSYLSAYLWRGGRWRMLWSQSSPAPSLPAR